MIHCGLGLYFKRALVVCFDLRYAGCLAFTQG